VKRVFGEVEIAQQMNVARIRRYSGHEILQDPCWPFRKEFSLLSVWAEFQLNRTD